MNQKPTASDRAREAPRPTPTKEALDALVHEVAEDAHRAPHRYLRETKVPAGGE